MVDGTAPRRKKHRNSKLGCATCKRRRVKCLEDLPECSNCAKHGVHCEYLDYSEDQLEAFRRLKEKQQQQVLPALGHSSSDAAAELELLSLGAKRPRKRLKARVESTEGSSRGSRLSLLSLKPTLPSGAGVKSQSDPNISVSQKVSVKKSSGTDPDLHAQLHPMNYDLSPGIQNLEVMTNPFASLHSAPSGLTQDFDNLLSTQDQKIIYPVYSSNEVTHGLSQGSPYHEPIIEFPEPSEKPLPGFANALPNAVPLRQKFKTANYPSHIGVNYSLRLVDTIRELGPLIARGLASLPQIRHLYHAWLAYFVYCAYTLQVMFLCLLNLTTNYLISNVFLGVDQKLLDTMFQVRDFRNTLVTHLIQHYAVAIRELRSLLNHNQVPELAASASYIFSLMSMYDPEATINSTSCFRDGMFSVLGYTVHLANKNVIAPFPLVPIHLQLVGNISRTVYFPAYDPAFLVEYEHMLHRVGHLFSRFLQYVTNSSTFGFISRTYEEFRHICHDTNTTYIPEANNSLHNLERQTELIFPFFYRWAKFNPTRLLVTRRSTDPLEKLLNMYIILFRKAVFAILPQGKFIYLRDLNSPLMLDVFNTFDDIEFFSSLDNPPNLCIDREVYQQSLLEIKTLAAYAIRVHRFIGARLQYLYTSLVFNEKVRRLYPIENVVEWRLTLTDIHATRKEFQERIGLVETMIKSFNSTYIVSQHYPRILSSEEDLVKDEPIPELGDVDLLSLDSRGFLLKDQSPPYPC